MRATAVRLPFMDRVGICPLRAGRSPGAAVCVDRALANLLVLFPTLSLKFAAAYLVPLSNLLPLEQALHALIDKFLEHGVPQSETWVEDSSSYTTLSDRTDIAFSSIEEKIDLYNRWCMYRLCVDFPRLSVALLRRALRMHNGRLTPTYKAVFFESQRALQEESSRGLPTAGLTVKVQGSNAKWLFPGGLNLLRYARNRTSMPPPELECPVFEMEWASLVMDVAREARLFCSAPRSVTNGFYDPLPSRPKHSAQLLDCSCGAETMCADKSSNRFHSDMEEVVFGGSKQICTLVGPKGTNEFAAPSPTSEAMSRPSTVIAFKSEQQLDSAGSRIQHDSEMTDMLLTPDVVRMVLPDKLDVQASQKMQNGVLRRCLSCESQLLKIGGCNKITCRCGQSVCYVCLAILSSKSNYDHFCQHKVWPSQKDCKWCNLCALWENEKDHGASAMN